MPIIDSAEQEYFLLPNDQGEEKVSHQKRSPRRRNRLGNRAIGWFCVCSLLLNVIGGVYVVLVARPVFSTKYIPWKGDIPLYCESQIEAFVTPVWILVNH